METGVVSYRSNYRAGSCKRSGVAPNPQVTEIFPEPGAGREAPNQATRLEQCEGGQSPLMPFRRTNRPSTRPWKPRRTKPGRETHQGGNPWRRATAAQRTAILVNISFAARATWRAPEVGRNCNSASAHASLGRSPAPLTRSGLMPAKRCALPHYTCALLQALQTHREGGHDHYAPAAALATPPQPYARNLLGLCRHSGHAVWPPTQWRSFIEAASHPCR